MKSKIIMTLLAGFWIFGLAQCGGKDSLSKSVKIEFVPDDPIVINAPLILFPGQTNERSIAAPWFIFSSRLENNSENKLYVVTYSYNIYSIKNGAQSAPAKGALDPTLSCDIDGESRAYLAVLEPGEAYRDLNYPSHGGANNGCDETDTIDSGSYESYYIQGLPAADNFNYNIEVNGEGWFVDNDDVPVERLILTGSFTTQ